MILVGIRNRRGYLAQRPGRADQPAHRQADAGGGSGYYPIPGRLDLN